MAAAKRTDSKKRNLKTGEGQREDGRYYYRYTDLSGKRKMIYAPTLADLRQKEKQITRDLEDGIDASKGQMSLNAMFDLYMGTKPKLKESSRQEYLSKWNTYLRDSELGAMPIASIKKVHILKFYSEMSKAGLAAKTQKSVHMLLASTLKLAVQSDYIRKNPTDGAAKEISGSKKDRKALTRKEQAALLEFVKGSNVYCVYYPVLTVFLHTGLREAELCGLQWSDVDFKEGVVHVRRQLLYRDYGDGYKHHVQSLKTSASERDIPMTAECKKAFQAQREYDMLLGTKRQKIDGLNDYAFINTKGMPYSNSDLNRVFYRMAGKYNQIEQEQAEKEKRDPVLLPRFSCHILRHCYAARMAESGVSPRALMSLMGHTNISVTMDIYANIDIESIKNEVREAEKLLNVI